MTRRLLKIALACLVTLLSVTSFATVASAHNSLSSSEPADGAQLPGPPQQMSFVFGKAVPLDTFSAEMVDGSGVRTKLTELQYGPAGDTEVLLALPATTGAVTVRWRIVGPDGHPVTGRVGFTVAAATPPTTVFAGTPATVPVVPVVDPAAPSATLAPPVATIIDPTPSPVDASTDATGFSEPYRTGDFARWLLRMLSYLAMIVVGGVLASTAFIWLAAWSHAMLRRLAQHAVIAIGLLGLAQLLVIASDIRGVAPWSAWSGLSAAFSTDAGIGFAARILLAGILAWILSSRGLPDERLRIAAANVTTLLLLGTWAWTGHSRSMRWAVIGVPLDVAHHAAAAAWLGGIAILGLVAIREANDDELVNGVNAFAWLAPRCVAVLVGTGVIQTIRLVGSPWRIFAVNHGQFLLLKVVVIGVMLKVADVNRQRVTRRFRDTETLHPRAIEMLRRALGTELAIGLAVIAVTAAMVVSPPATAQEAAAVVPTAESTIAGAGLSTTQPAAPPVAAEPTTAATIPVAVTCTISTTLQSGSTGPDVACLQQALLAEGLLTGPATGTFDDATDQAVRTYQETQSLLVDGIVGPATAGKLGLASTG